MDIHKPHAAKSWKEFFIELGTVIIGILIALSLEQAVEGAHDRSRAAQARENIRTEIAYDTGLLASRDSVETCVSRRLDEIEGLIRASAAGTLPQGPLWIGHPPFWPMLHSQYNAATQSGAVSLLPTQEQASYSTLYTGFEENYQAQLTEQTAWTDLRMLEKHPAGSPALDLQLRSALQKAREARWHMEVAAASVEAAAAQLAVKPNVVFRWTQQSACIPLNTARAEAEKQVVKGRVDGAHFDEP